MKQVSHHEPFTTTDAHSYTYENHQILVEIENTSQRFRWRLTVDGDASEPYGYYQGILLHKGFAVATAYWEGTFEEFVPFCVDYANHG